MAASLARYDARAVLLFGNRVCSAPNVSSLFSVLRFGAQLSSTMNELPELASER